MRNSIDCSAIGHHTSLVVGCFNSVGCVHVDGSESELQSSHVVYPIQHNSTSMFGFIYVMVYFCTGVRYIIDNVLGNCTLLPLLNTSYGATENITAMKNNGSNSVNGSYSIHIKNPLQLFNLNNNFTYVGKVFMCVLY